MRRGSGRRVLGPPERCARAACFWSGIPSRRSTAFAAPTLTPTWRRNAPFSRKMGIASSRLRQTSDPGRPSSILPMTGFSRCCQKRPDSPASRHWRRSARLRPMAMPLPASKSQSTAALRAARAARWQLVREHEAIIVAEIVQRLIGNYQIWDKRTQAMRVCRRRRYRPPRPHRRQPLAIRARP